MFRLLLLVIGIGSLFSCSRKLISVTANDQKIAESVIDTGTQLISKVFKNDFVYTLEGGRESFETRLWLWEHAEKSIDIQHYIFKKDNSGLISSDYLVKAADRGVKVRILLDEVAIKLGAREMATLDSHENIEVRIYNPGLFHSKSIFHRIKLLLTKLDRLQCRMHIKTIIVDSHVCITGGRNIADEYFGRDHRYNFRDRDIVFTGASVHKTENVFEEYWNDNLNIPISQIANKKYKKKDPKRFNRLHCYANDTSNLSLQLLHRVRGFPSSFNQRQQSGDVLKINTISFVADSPAKIKNSEGVPSLCNDSIINLLEQAKHTIIIQTPYLIFDDRSKDLFTKLIKKGIKIMVLTNSLASTDNNEAFSGYQRDRAEILGLGIDVYEFKPDPLERYQLMDKEIQEKLNYKPIFGLHSKTILIDDHLSVVGTYNFDPRSAYLNVECIAIIRSPQFMKYILKYVNEEFLPENSWHISQTFNPDSVAGLYKRFKIYTRKIVPKKIL